MTTADAQKIALVLSTVDDGCIECVTRATAQMTAQFPQFDWPQLVADASDSHWTADLLRS